MIATLAWKELREHQAIWVTMVATTLGLGCGLPWIVSQGDVMVFMAVSTLAILGLAVTYGVVCGALMFAGEHETGTLSFLDVFHGRRGSLWASKAAIGAMLAIAQGLTVALFLYWIKQEPPTLGRGFMNRPDAFGMTKTPLTFWFAILPLVTLEAAAWGLLGSSMTRRVLAGAAIGAVGLSVTWMVTFGGPFEVVVAVRTIAAIVVAAISFVAFVKQPKDSALGRSAVEAAELDYDARADDARAEFLDRYDELERDDELLRQWSDRTRAEQAAAGDVMLDRETAKPQPKPARRLHDESEPDAQSPGEVLWWLVRQQYLGLLIGMAFGSFVAGLIIPANAQVLWPMATLVLGILCGVAAFAPEQRELSYQFLAVQHLPLHAIWRFKILFWGAAALLLTLLMSVGALLNIGLQIIGNRNVVSGFDGPLIDLMGPIGFFGLWLAYGFAVGQIVVWLCRKNILALLVSVLIAAGAIGLLLPTTIAGGMSGWQLWLTPAILMFAGWRLVRAWAGGRIQERRPLAALAGFGALALVWTAAVYGYRAWEIPDAGPPIDVVAFREAIPVGNEGAAKEIHGAVLEFNLLRLDEVGLNGARVEIPVEQLDPMPIARARGHLRAATGLPAGVLESPRSDGAPTLQHLIPAQKLADVLIRLTPRMDQDAAVDCLSEVLTLSRNLRKMAPVDSYLAGIEIESLALAEIDVVLARKRPTRELLIRLEGVLKSHAEQTPPVIECVRTECFRSTGMVQNPQSWNLTEPDDRRAPRWLRGNVALSLETPWESERKMRLWRLAWAGLLRGFETPAWKHPENMPLPPTSKGATQSLMSVWLPGDDGVNRERMARLLDSSWLADERLFFPAQTLRNAALRAQVRIDTTRLALAVAIHRLDVGEAPADLDALAKRFPAGLPTDPFTGEAYRYSKDAGNTRVWSTGPDRVDDGGHIDGDKVPDDDPRWRSGKLDLVKHEPTWQR